MRVIIRATIKPFLATFIFSIICFTANAQTAPVRDDSLSQANVKTKLSKLPDIKQASMHPPVNIYVPFYSYLQKTIRYPIEARTYGLTGRIMVTFSVHYNKVDSIKIRKTIGYGTDEEITRVLQKYKPLPNMSQGTYALNVFFGLVGRDDLGRNTSIDADHANALKDMAALNQTSATEIIDLDEVVIVAYRSR